MKADGKLHDREACDCEQAQEEERQHAGHNALGEAGVAEAETSLLLPRKGRPTEAENDIGEWLAWETSSAGTG